MCDWHYAIYKDDDWDARLARFDFAGGVRANEDSRGRVLKAVRRQLAGYLNAHPEERASLRIVEMSCNGPQRIIKPYGETGEERLYVGGWEGLPGEAEAVPTSELLAAPEIVAPGPSSRPSALATEESDARPRRRPPRTSGAETDVLLAALPRLADSSADGDEERAVILVRDGERVAVYTDATQALAAIDSLGADEQRGLAAYEADLHGEGVKVWPLAEAADIEAVERLSGRRLSLKEPEDMSADDWDAIARYYTRPVKDPWEQVREHFDGFVVKPALKEIERLKTWAAIASQSVSGRSNDEEVEVRASLLYSLRHALRSLEAAEGKLLVGHDDNWEPEPTKAVSSLVEAKAEVAHQAESGRKAAVYRIEPSGVAGDRLYPLDELPYAVWSTATANLIGEYQTADEAIAVARADADDLVAFLDEPGAERAIAVFDPNGLTKLTLAERRARLATLGRWPLGEGRSDELV